MMGVMSSGVLLLNASYDVLRIVSVNRAVCMVIEGKAEVLEESDEPMRSPSFEMKAPSVIKLKHFVTIPFRTRVPLNRKTLMARDGKVCQFNDCTRVGNTIEHLQPRSRGGAHEWTNVVAACQKCNSTKDDRTLEEMGWTLKRQPQTPSGQKWLVIGLADKRNEDWAEFLSYA